MQTHRDVELYRDGRPLAKVTFHDEDVYFVATNERLQERVTNLSHEDHVLDTLVEESQPEDVFWDVGACLGIHTFTLAKHLPDGHVASFEPMHTNRGVLIDNLQMNRLNNVWVVPKALADESGEEEFAIRQSQEAGYGRHSLDTGDYDKLRTVTVEKERGDTVDQPVPNLVKIDVEGAEGLVLEGMKSLLRRDECRVVVLETHEPNDVQPSHEDFGYTEDEIKELLRDCGFSVNYLKKDYHIIGRKL